MDLWELYHTLAPHFSPSRAKDVKTAVRVLARALGFADPRHCPPDRYRLPLPQLRRLLDEKLAGKGPHTLRNIKNNLSGFFRTAEAQGLVTPLTTTPTPRFDPEARPHRRGSEHTEKTGFYLPRRFWPPELEDAFAAFGAWATAARAEGRPATWRKRQITLTNYQRHLESFFGYLHHIRQHAPLHFDLLFEEPLIRDYVQWSITDRHGQVTAHIHVFLIHLLALTRQYRPLPDLRSRIKELQRSLPKPPPVYNKTDVWVPLATLDQVGQALWPRKQPQDLRSPGGTYAARAGMSLMLRLWSRRPYRQRNMREMQLGENLYRDAEGKWTLRFAGEQLKVAQKGGHFNIFTLPFPEDLVPQLEAYLHTWRPCLERLSASRFAHVFLNRYGKPYGIDALNLCVKHTLYRYTGKACHPHLIRTIWATEYIRQTGNVYNAAILLNDRLETVVKQYSHLMEQGVAEQTDRWVHQRLSA